ncbi:MAG: VTT domain-containing protein [Actinobacteria bacterium]|nr:VTT domain-containing protein [Actinomycetota bacterium]
MRRHWTQIVSLAIAFAVVLTIWLVKPDLKQLQAYGLLGIFVTMLVSSATVLVPVPGLTMALAVGPHWNPLLIGLAGGAGAAIGELTGFMAGYGSRFMIEEHPNRLVRALEPWMRRYGFLAVLALAAIPNPAFDAVGIVAGALRLPAWQFFLAAGTGNSIKLAYIAMIGASIGGWLFT